MLKKNVGKTDKIIRVIVSLALAFAAYKSTGVLAIVLGVFAAVMMFTAVSGWCWLYALLGISSCATCNTDKPAAPPENKPQG